MNNYYEESIIRGKLCCRREPDDPWKPLRNRELTRIIQGLKLEVRQLENRLQAYSNSKLITTDNYYYPEKIDFSPNGTLHHINNKEEEVTNE